MSDRETAASAPLRAPSSSDVARLAGVSQKTVSRVMNDEPRVSAAVRERVREAATRLGYRPNSAARALAAGRTRRIGFVSLGTTLHGPVATLVAAERAARAHGYSLAIATTPDSEAAGVRAGVDSVLAQGVDAIVLSEPVDLGGVDLTVEVPVLIFGRFPGLRAPHVISTLNAGDRSATTAVRYLMSTGHRTVHHIAGPESWYAAREREQGWESALREAGAVVPAPVRGDWTSESGYRCGAVLAHDPNVTAVFCANDDMAIGALRALHDAGRSVPNDISVLGFDDVPAATYTIPALTTIRHPFDAGSAAGIAALIATVEHPDLPSPALLEPAGELIVRESTGAPPGALGRPSGGGRPT